MRRKVLIAITKSNFGGAQRYVYDLATSLPSESFDVAVVCGGDGPLVRMLGERGVRIISLARLERDVKFLGDIKAFFELIGILRRERPHVLHLNSSKMGGLGVVAGRITGIRRIVFTAHGWEFNAPRPRWQRLLIRIFSTCIVMLAHRTIAVSLRLKQDIGLFQNKITVVHNGVAAVPLLDHADARAALERCSATPIDMTGMWFGTIAELHPVKGLDTAIAAFAAIARAMPDAHYVIIGEGQERTLLEKLVRDHRLETRVHLVGFIPHAVSYLHAFDVFVLPSRSEGLAYAILEAGLASLPMIASRVGGIPEVISSPEYGILVESGDVGAFADAMHTLTHDHNKRTRMGTALHQRVINNFSLNAMVQATIDVYR